jgi:hypothetical protein
MTMAEVADASAIIADAADPDANIIFGAAIDENMNNKIKISVIATGFADKTGYNQRSMFGAYGSDTVRKIQPARSKSDEKRMGDGNGDRIDRAPDGWVQPQTKSQVTGSQDDSSKKGDATSPFVQSAAFDDTNADDEEKASKADKDDDKEPPQELSSDDFDDEFEIPAFLRQRK